MTPLAQFDPANWGINPYTTTPIAPQSAAEPFVWGAGGAQLSPDDLARQRQVAQALLKSNYSPVANVWQGLGRVADNVMGALDEKSLDKKQAASATSRSSDIAALLGEGNADLAHGFTSSDPVVSALAGDLLKSRIKPAAQPYRFEDNAGNVWSVGQDGTPQRIFTDTVPKYYIQGDQALEIPNPFNTASAPPAATAELPQGWTIDEGGAGSNAGGVFPER